MHLYQRFTDEILKVVTHFQDQGVLPTDLSLEKITLEPPKDPTHGDLSTNVAMVLNKAAGKNPKELAQLFTDELVKHQDVESVSIAGPGFINLTLKPYCWLPALEEILKVGDTYGQSDMGQGHLINLEYVSANPTGPVHIGHCRGAIIGDVLANLLSKAGYKIIKEYYINDAGGQANELARSSYIRYLEALGQPVQELGAYGGDYLIPVGQALAQEFGDRFVGKDESEWLLDVRAFAIDMMIDRIKQDLKELNIEHDVFFSENAMIQSGKVQEAIDTLKAQGLVYEGVLEKPKGQEIEDWEPRPQTLFKATAFGDDMDRPLVKSDGSWTYFASDIAYHLDKFKRGAKTLVNILGADHGGYIKRISAGVTAITQGQAHVHCLTCQMVRFIDQGQVLKMSKRAGNFITVKDAIDKVGIDALRFIMVTRKNDAPLDFDFAAVIEQSKDNPVFYVQYAYARSQSIKRHAIELIGAKNYSREILLTQDFTPLMQAEFLPILKLLNQWPRQIEMAARSFEPHRITYFLIELASEFHALWNKGKDQTELRFIDPENMKKTISYMILIEALASTLESGLKIIGIKPKEVM